jgi:hypothetical protein
VESFAAGRIDSDLRGRVSAPIYQESVFDSLNMVSRLRGPIKTRGGFEHVAVINETTDRFRKLPFYYSSGKSYFVGIGNDNIYVLDENGIVTGGIGGQPGGAGNLLLNGDFGLGLSNWINRTAFAETPIRVTYGNTDAASLTWDSSRPSARLRLDGTDNTEAIARNIVATGQLITLAAGTYDLTGSYEFVDAFPSDYAELTVTVPTDPDDLFPILFVIPGNELIRENLPSGSTEFSTQFTLAQESQVYIEVSGHWGEFGQPITDRSMYLKEVSVIDPSANQGGGGTAQPIIFTNPWTNNIDDVDFAVSPNQKSMLLFHKDVAPRAISYDDVNDSWSFTPVTFIGQPPEWAANNWPSKLSFNNRRLLAASTPSNPNRVWASASDNFLDFTQQASPTANDAFAFDLIDNSKVQFIDSLEEIIIGSDTRPWELISSTPGVVAPNDYVARRQSLRGASSGDFLNIDAELLYLSDNNRRVQAITREDRGNRYVIKEVSWMANELTKHSVGDMALTQYPDQIVWFRKNGSVGDFVACTYNPEEKDFPGWHAHHTDGDILSFASTFVNGQYELFAVIKRHNESGSYVSYERYRPDIHLDSYLRQFYPTPTTTLVGLDRFNGKSVYVYADGAGYGPYEVLNGSISLPETVQEVYVGFGFSTLLVTRDLEGGFPAGTMQGTQQSWNKIWVRGKFTVPPVINGRRAPERSVKINMDTAVPSDYRDVEITSDGIKSDNRITITEGLPVPLEVIAVFGEMATGST